MNTASALQKSKTDSVEIEEKAKSLEKELSEAERQARSLEQEVANRDDAIRQLNLDLQKTREDVKSKAEEVIG